MENNIAATLLILALAFPAAVFAGWANGASKIEPPDVTLYYDTKAYSDAAKATALAGGDNWTSETGVVEPPKEMTLGWNVNEVPSNVTVYYDVNGDKKPDVVFAHPILFVNIGVYCDVKRTVDEQYWMFSTCPADHAADYFVTRQWALYKFIGGGWHRVFQHVDKYERDRTCRIQQDKQGAGNQDLQGEGKSCTGD